MKEIVPPKCRDNVFEIYRFIVENSHYTINRGVGMGADIAIAPNMIKIKKIAEEEGIEIYKYKNFFIDFIDKKTKQEQRKE